MQIPFAQDNAPLRTQPSEDCLYLNVWRPADAGGSARLPVMVWIYGGGFVIGGSSPAVYDGSALARQGIVLVSFNYRLGRFGFFAHPSLTAAHEDGGLLGNYGYMDQIAALQWVQRNIARFGGDPDNVTIFGESAGGGSVNTLMTSPAGEGLFAKAIVMSGGGRSAALMGSRTLAQAEQTGEAFALWAGVPPSGGDALAQLRALPASTIAQGVEFGGRRRANDPTSPPPASGPMLDGRIVVDGVEDVYRRGGAARVPFMAGANTADLGFPSSGDPFVRFGADAERARQIYTATFGEGQSRLSMAISTDTMMIEPARFTVEAMRRMGQPAWHYRAGYIPASMRSSWAMGLPHSNDIPFFFDTIDSAAYRGATTEADHAMSSQMSAYFVNFAKRGDPNGPGLPSWPVYSSDTRPIMNFTNEGPQGGADPWRERLDLIEAVANAAR